MNGRSSRLKSIKKIILENKIHSQDHLLKILLETDVSVTQATLSRDLKMLKVGKISDGNKGYYYTLPEEGQDKISLENYRDDFLRGFTSIAFSKNLCVIRTLPGHANAVAMALDNLELNDIIGTIAGDDTIMAILREDVTHDQIRDQLNSVISGLELES